MNAQNKRERLIDSAAELFHRHGLHSTSLADIAKHAEIPIGNVYYYFKAKDDLAIAAIDKRKEHFRAVYKALEEAFDDPRQRLIEYLGYYEKMRDEYYTHGCPIGRILSESPIKKDDVAMAASSVFDEFIDWASAQFRSLGHEHATAKSNAISMMAAVQGAIAMARAQTRADIITSEMARTTKWLDSLPNRRISIGKAGIKSSSAA